VKTLFKKPPVRASPTFAKPIPKKRKKEQEEASPLDKWKQGFSVKAAMEAAEHDCPPLACPSEAPLMPDDISHVGADELGELFGRFSAYAAFLEEAVALADIDAGEKEAYLEHIQAKVRLTKSGTVQDKNAKALNSEEYIHCEMESFKAGAKAKLLKARLRGYDKCAAALSREITRRSEGRG
jgi:hypothetical protein